MNPVGRTMIGDAMGIRQTQIPELTGAHHDRGAVEEEFHPWIGNDREIQPDVAGYAGKIKITSVP